MKYTLKHYLLISILIFSCIGANAQEINATAQVIAPSVQMTNKQILVTLQNAIQQFVSTRKWTDESFESREKIEMTIFLNVNQLSTNNEFSASIQINSTRPIFNAVYKSTNFTFEDDDVVFVYREFENLDFQENQNVNALTTLIAYYVNIVLGYDFDSFAELGGTSYFKKAQNIVNMMVGQPGWNQTDGKGIRNRYYLAENLNNTKYQPIRLLNFVYHRKGMDQMYEKPEQARAAILDAIKGLQELSSIIPNSLLQKTFFSAKVNELVDIFKGATVPEKNNILTVLSQLDPGHTKQYEKIKA